MHYQQETKASKYSWNTQEKNKK